MRWLWMRAHRIALRCVQAFKLVLGLSLGFSGGLAALGLQGLCQEAQADVLQATPRTMADAKPWPDAVLKAFNRQGIASQDISAFAMPIFAIPMGALSLPLPPGVSASKAMLGPAARYQQAYALGARRLVNPASVTKVFSTGFALQQLQSTYRFKTGFYAEQEPIEGVLRGPLYIKGGGDPSLSTANVWSALRTLRARGIKTLRGPVVLDDSLFANLGVAYIPSTQEAFDEAPYRAYHAQPYALLLNQGAMALDIELNAGSVRIVPEEAPKNWAFVSELNIQGGECGAWKNALEVRTQKQGRDVVVTLKGGYPRACGSSRLPIRIAQQDWLWESWLAELWAQLGGEWEGSVVRGKTPSDAVLLYTHMGQTVGDVIKSTNKWSNNVIAQHLALAVIDGPGQFAPRLLQWLAGMGVDTEGWVFENGSGLSRQTRITMEGLAVYLANMAQRSDFPDFVASLPRAAADGTLQRRLGGIGGHAYLKTGSLSGVRSLGGYVRDENGVWWVLGATVQGANADNAWPGFEALVEFVYRNR